MKQNNNYELVKFVDEELELDVNFSPKEETIWMTQEELSILYLTSISTINYHIKNIYNSHELDENSTFRKIRKVQVEGNRTIERTIKYYNLDVIILIGYRVNSIKAQVFRKWANKVLRDYLLKGYVINENRVLVSNENFNNLLVVVNDMKSNQIDINNRVDKLEDKVFNKEYNLDKILFNGQFYDAYTLSSNLSTLLFILATSFESFI